MTKPPCKESNLKEIEKRQEKKDLILLVKKMVSIPTESPSGKGYKEFIGYVEELVQERLPNFQTEKIDIPMEAYEGYSHIKEKFEGPRTNILIKAPYEKRPKIHIHGHYDVVMAGDLEKWTVTRPFNPIVKNGRIYGRGSADMKGAIACLIKALEIIEKLNLEPRFSAKISLTCDEEYDEYSGLRYLVDQTGKGKKYIDADTILMLDGLTNCITIGISGHILFKVSTKGKTVHSSRSFKGINSIFLMLPILEALQELSLEIARRWSKYPTLPEIGIPRAKPCLSVNLVSGGHAINAIPDTCIIEGDRRVIPEETLEEAVLEIVNAILDVKLRHKLDFDYEVHPANPPCVSSGENKYLQMYKKYAESIFQRKMPVVVDPGSADFVFVKTQLNKDFFLHGLVDEESEMHGFNESISISNALNLTKTLIGFLTNSSDYDSHFPVI